jgi:glycosyltransferase involved in cell wall biosynthesis
MIKISIIIPAYNAEATIERCVTSITNQGYKNIEIIIVDNKSSDRTLDICKSLSVLYKEILVIECEEHGVSSARNKGLEYATGDIIGFCDSDDFYEKKSLSVIAKEFQDDPNLDILLTGFFRTKIDKGITDKTIIHLKKNKYYNSEKIMCLIMSDSRIMGSVWNKFYKRNLVGKVRFNELLSYCEDTHFNMVILSNNKNCRCKIISTPTYNYVCNLNSVTNNLGTMFDNDNNLKYIVSCYAILKDCKVSNKVRRYIGYDITSLAIDIMHGYSIKEEQKSKLKHEIKCHFIDFISCFFETQIKSNIKRLIWMFSLY